MRRALSHATLMLLMCLLPFARPVFEAAAHFAWEWALIALLALAPTTLIDAAKLLREAAGRRAEAGADYAA